MRTTVSATLAELAGATLAAAPGATQPAQVGPDVVIDARKATPGSLFVAIPGEKVDGHDYASQAAENGATAVIATRQTGAPLAHLLVEESVAGLSRLAHGLVEQEQRRGLLTLAVTGSSGKTSTKDLLAQLLQQAGPTVSPVGSFNNEIGVPLTACGVDERTRFLISEMGARGPGHVAWLCSITRPDVAMVLNVGTAHLGEFGSREAIAQAKGEIVAALGPEGWGVLNADDPLVAAMAPRCGGRLAWWTREDFAATGGTPPPGGLHVRAREVRATALQQYGFQLVVERDGTSSSHPVQLGLLGSHQVSNALAAATAAICAGLEPDEVARALSAATTRSPWRMELVERADGAAILNDAYNANPDSMREAVETLGRIGRDRRSEQPGARAIAVLGDMRELGEESDALHRELGELAVRQGIDEVVAVGAWAQQIVAGAREAGGSARAMERDEVAAALALGGGDVVLVKASRGIALEVVAAELAAQVGADLAPAHRHDEESWAPKPGEAQ